MRARREKAALRGVLFDWDERAGLTNTRRAVTDFETIGTHSVLLLVPESDGGDLDGDGDVLDSVLELYDLCTGRSSNLGLASSGLLDSAHGRSAISVLESQQGADLNGDGDLLDIVLHLVEVP